MANPQPDEFTKVANELMEQVPFFKFNGAQMRLILVIWRNTYGWSRKDHDFSITFLHGHTGLSESAVKRELAALIEARVLVVTKRASRTTSRRLAFNKDYDTWKIARGGEQMDSDFKVHDHVPNEEKDQVHDCVPNKAYEVHDCAPKVATIRYTIGPPDKEKDLLKKVIIKESENSFDEFWNAYPRRISKAAALKAWKKLQKEPGFDPIKIILHTKNFAETHKLLQTQTSYIPHPSTYLNQQRFLDYDRVDPEGLVQERLAGSAQKSKFDKNKELLLGGVSDGYSPSQVHPVQSFGSLPKPSGAVKGNSSRLD